jgi:hypothetical protein
MKVTKPPDSNWNGAYNAAGGAAPGAAPAPAPAALKVTNPPSIRKQRYAQTLPAYEYAPTSKETQ